MFSNFESPLLTSQWNWSLVSRDIEILSHFYWTIFFSSFSFVSKKGSDFVFSRHPRPPNHWLKYSSLYLNNPTPPPSPALPSSLLENLNTLLSDSAQLWRGWVGARLVPSDLMNCSNLWTLNSFTPKMSFLDQESGFSLGLFKNYL